MQSTSNENTYATFPQGINTTKDYVLDFMNIPRVDIQQNTNSLQLETTRKLKTYTDIQWNPDIGVIDPADNYLEARELRYDIVRTEKSRDFYSRGIHKYELWLKLIHAYETSKKARWSPQIYFATLSKDLKSLVSSHSGKGNYYQKTEDIFRRIYNYVMKFTVHKIPFHLRALPQIKKNINGRIKALVSAVQDLNKDAKSLKIIAQNTEIFYLESGVRIIVHLDQQLGKGSFSSVFKGVVEDTGDFVAVKKLHFKNHFWQEYSFINRLSTVIQYKSIVPLIGACEQLGYLVFEFANGGNLEDALKAGKVQQMSGLQKYTQLLKIASTLKILHEKWVLHLDLFPKNILINNGKCYIADFGVSVRRNTSPRRRQNYLGPISKVADKKGSTFNVDTYSLMCLIVQTFEGTYLSDKQLTEELAFPGRFLHQIKNFPWLEKLFYQIDWDSPTDCVQDVSYIIHALEVNRPLYEGEEADPTTLEELRDQRDTEAFASKIWRLSQELRDQIPVVKFLTVLACSTSYNMRFAALHQLKISNYKQPLGQLFKDLYTTIFRDEPFFSKKMERIETILALIQGEYPACVVFEKEQDSWTFWQTTLTIMKQTTVLSEIFEEINKVCGFPVFTQYEQLHMEPNHMVSFINLFMNSSEELPDDLHFFSAWLLQVYDDPRNENFSTEQTGVQQLVIKLLAFLPIDPHVYSVIQNSLKSKSIFNIGLIRESIDTLSIIGTTRGEEWRVKALNDIENFIFGYENDYEFPNCNIRALAIDAFCNLVAAGPFTLEEKDKIVADMCAKVEQQEFLQQELLTQQVVWQKKFKYF